MVFLAPLYTVGAHCLLNMGQIQLSKLVIENPHTVSIPKKQ